jgi:hypothetical protein
MLSTRRRVKPALVERRPLELEALLPPTAIFAKQVTEAMHQQQAARPAWQTITKLQMEMVHAPHVLREAAQVVWLQPPVTSAKQAMEALLRLANHVATPNTHMAELERCCAPIVHRHFPRSENRRHHISATLANLDTALILQDVQGVRWENPSISMILVSAPTAALGFTSRALVNRSASIVISLGRPALRDRPLKVSANAYQEKSPIPLIPVNAEGVTKICTNRS